MNLPTINMSRKAAKEAFEHYRAAVRARHDAEDAAIMRGYKALSAGNQVLDLQAAFDAAGLDDLSRPRLAIAKAKDRRVFCILRDQVCVFTSQTNAWGSPRDNASDRVTVALPANPDRRRMSQHRDLIAPVPNIPPQFRPKRIFATHRVLWEVEKWGEVPEDPMLLKALGGNLYAVLAVWDLTELERAVLCKTRAVQ